MISCLKKYPRKENLNDKLIDFIWHNRLASISFKICKDIQAKPPLQKTQLQAALEAYLLELLTRQIRTLLSRTFRGPLQLGFPIKQHVGTFFTLELLCDSFLFDWLDFGIIDIKPVGAAGAIT